MASRTGAGGAAVTPARARAVLAVLLLVYVLNFLDRQILGILAVPIKRDLALTDTQLGALGGLAFAMLYSTLGIPLAVLSDRTGRSRIVAASLAVFSLFSALCGAATGFWSLFLFRLGVGVGEAGGVAPSYALVADHFPPERRARALAIYNLGVPLGLTAGSVVGGALAAAFSWRVAFMAVGIAGLLMVPLCAWVVRDPAHVRAVPVRAPLGETMRLLAAKPAFWLLSTAAASSSLVGYGLAFWVPSILVRSYGLTLVQASQYFGMLLLIGGTAGVLAGGWIADRAGRTDRGAYVRVPAIAWCLAAPAFLIGFLIPEARAAWVFFLIPNALNILWLGPIVTAVQHLVPRHMRATASACYLFVLNLLGLGGGALVLGALSDAMAARYGDQSLRAAAIVALGFYLLAAALALAAIRPLRRAWVDDDVSA